MSIGNSPSPDDLSVGRALAQARAAAGLSVDQVSTTTRVRVPILQAIERDDFSRCGGDVYARGHIRSIARAVGVDPDPLVERYAATHAPAEETVPVAPLYEAEKIKSEPRRPNWTAAMVAAIVAVVGFLGFTLFSGGGGSGKPSQAGATPTSTTASPSATSASPQPSAPSSQPPSPQGTQGPQGNNAPSANPTDPGTGNVLAAAPPGKVTVKVSAVGGASWILATDHNGKQLFQGSLKAGDSQTWTDDKKIKLVVGNAGAVQMFVNGKDLGPAGDQGQVVRLTYTPGDPTQG